MTISAHAYSATLTEGAGYPLDLKAGSATLDDSWAPHVQASITVAQPAQSVQELIDAREDRRVTVAASAVYVEPTRPPQSRTFDLGLRSRTIDHAAGEVTLQLASDEALLQDDVLLGETPNTDALAHQDSLRAIINGVLARVGAALEPTRRTTHTNLVGDPNTTVAAGRWSWPAAAVTSVSIVGGKLRIVGNGTSVPYVYPTVQASAPSTAGRYSITAGKPFTLRAEVTNPSATATVWVALGVSYYNSTGGGSGASQIPARAALAPGETRVFETSGIAIDGSTPTAGLLPLLYLYGNALGQALAGATVDSTHWQLEIGDTVPTSHPFPFFSGDTPAAGSSTFAWAGAANASISSQSEAIDGMGDAPFHVLSDATNLITNPSGETNVTNWTLPGGTLARSTARAWVGAASIQCTVGAAGLVGWFACNTSTYVAASAGKTYTWSFYINSAVARSVYAQLRFLDSSNVQLQNTLGVASVSVVGAFKRYTITALAPTGTTRVAPMIFANGSAATDVHYIDGALLTEGADLLEYFDGDTADTDEYGYNWTGVAHASTATRSALIDRSPDLLNWQPGESAWDFIQPLFQAAGFRLYCDERRRWYLVDSSFIADGQIQLSIPSNLKGASDSISRDNDEWFDSALVIYRWNDSTDTPQVRYDSYAEPGATRTRVFEYSRPYPGPGAASYLVRRAAGKGRTLDLSAVSQYSVEPSQPVTATLPGTPVQTGVVARVTFDFGDDTMQLTTRGLTDTPPDSWLFVPADLSWAEIDPAATWANWTF